MRFPPAVVTPPRIDLKTPVALVIPGTGQIKMTMRSCLAETNTHKLMTIASLAIQVDVFNYANARIQFKSMQISRKV